MLRKRESRVRALCCDGASVNMTWAASSLSPVADLINAEPKDIIFTSGATESNNIAIKGVARFYKCAALGGGCLAAAHTL